MYPAQATNATAQHFIQAFSWTLLHSLWQGLLLAVLTGLVLTFAKRSAAAVRYNLVLLQFALFILACGGTFAWEWLKTPHQNVVHLAAGAVKGASLPLSLNADSIRQFARMCIGYFTANAPVVVLLWFILFVFRSMRMMGSLVYLHRARNRFVYQPDAEWKAKVATLCQKLQLKKAVTLLESGYVKAPMVIGHLKPVILVPIGLIAGLPAGQVEAVLLHELAHIRRHDYIVNFLQTLAETVFFFNPGLLWISSVLRDERENCCDDIALAQTKNKREFVEALISFKEHAIYGTRAQVAFPGKKNHLLNRVSRIIHNRNKAFGPGEKIFFMTGVIILSAMVATAAISQVKSMQYANRHIEHTVRAPKASSAIATIARVPRISKKLPGTAERMNRLPLAELRNSSPIESPEVSLIPPDAVSEKGQPLTEKQQADNDQLQALKDQEQAKRDEAQALIDQAQARRDQEQALKDQAQARADQEQAKHDQEQVKAGKDQQEKHEQQQDKEQAKRNEEQAARNAEQAKRNQAQDRLNAEQARKNAEQAVRNGEQAKRNEQQNKLNAEQAIHNEEQARKNQVNVQ